MEPQAVHNIVQYIGFGLFVVMVLFSLVNFILPLLASYTVHFFSWLTAQSVRFDAYLVKLETARKHRRSPSEPVA